MGNAQQPNQTITQDLNQNVNHFLTNIESIKPPHPLPLTIQTNEQPNQFPPTPNFQQSRKIATVQLQQAPKINDQGGGSKYEVESVQEIKLEQKQIHKLIKKAKFEYEKKASENLKKFNEIHTQKENCKKLYEDYDSMEQSQDQQSHTITKDQTVLIWGKRVNLNSTESLDDFNKYKYPKNQPDDSNDEYTNWKIYKKKIANDRLKEIQAQEERLRKQEERLRQRYEVLLQMKAKGQNLNVTSRSLNEDYTQASQQNITQSFSSPSIDQKTLNNSTHPPSFSTQLNQPLDHPPPSFEQSITSQQSNDPHPSSSSFISHLFPTNQQNKNPQNLSTTPQAQVEFLAKQIFHYQMYAMKRRTSFVHSENDTQYLVSPENQYPSNRKNYVRPVRCQEYLHGKANYRSKSKRKRTKAKQEKYSTMGQFEGDSSVYVKVYEKIPKTENKKMMYSQRDAKIQQVTNFYPYQLTQSKEMFPQTLKVNDTIKVQQYNDGLYLSIGSNEKRQQISLQNKFDFLQRKGTPHLFASELPESTYQQNQISKRKKQQRSYQARILQRVKIKNL